MRAFLPCAARIDILSDDSESDGSPRARTSGGSSTGLGLEQPVRRAHALGRGALRDFERHAASESRALDARIRELRDEFRLRLHSLEGAYARDVAALGAELSARVREERARGARRLDGRASYAHVRLAARG